MKIEHVSVVVHFAFFFSYLLFVLKVYVLKSEVKSVAIEIVWKNSMLLF